MFGKKKETDVRLTKDQVKALKKNMSKNERKAFEKRQRQMESDRDWDEMIEAEFFIDD